MKPGFFSHSPFRAQSSQCSLVSLHSGSSEPSRMYFSEYPMKASSRLMRARDASAACAPQRAPAALRQVSKPPTTPPKMNLAKSQAKPSWRPKPRGAQPSAAKPSRDCACKYAYSTKVCLSFGGYFEVLIVFNLSNPKKGFHKNRLKRLHGGRGRPQ